MKKTKLNVKKIEIASMFLIILATFSLHTLDANARLAAIEGGGGGIKGNCDVTGVAPKGNYAKLTIIRSSVTVNLSSGTVYISQMNMDDEWAICVDPDRYTGGGYYTSAGVAGSEYLKARKALAYLLKENPDINGELGLMKFTVAQLYAWGIENDEEIKQAYVQIYEQFHGNKNATTILEKFMKNFGSAFMKAIRSEIAKTTPVTATLYVKNGAQSFISRSCGSNEPLCAIKDGVYYGPNGEKLSGKEEFDELCDEVPDENKCDPAQGTGDGECTNTEFHDPSWSCIAGNSDYQDLSITDNPYCSIYCREDVRSDFPFETKTFQAGQYLTVGTGFRNIWGPVSFQGKRECRMYYNNGKTEGINTEQFVSNYNNVVSQIPKLYDTWQKEKAKQQAIDSMKTEQTCPTTGTDKVDPRPCGANQHESGGSCYSWDWKVKISDRCDSDRWYSDGKCVKNVEIPNTATRYLSTSYTYKDSYGNTHSENIAGGCTKPTSSVNAARDAYNKAVNKANTLLNYMRQCSEMKTTYTLNPEVNFSYKAGAYNWSGQLKSTGGSEIVETKLGGSKNTSKYTNIRGVNSGCFAGNSDCSVAQITCTDGGGCKVASVTISNVNVTSKTTETVKTVNYSLPDNLFRYTDKVQGNVTTSIPSDLKYTNTYIDLRESTLPLDTYVKTGRYTIDLSYSKIGNIVGDTAHFDKTITDMDSDYKCPILIKNDIMGKECEKDPEGCDPVGIDVIYRTIKLGSSSVAFPSIDGNGRKPGSNWYSGDGSLVNNYITNNRGVKGEEVYNLTPLYKITLTPAIIKQIRDYNKKVDYGTYDTLTCSVDDSGRASGRKCISSFIHSNVTAGGKSYNFSGYFDSKATCQNITTGNFNSCANK